MASLVCRSSNAGPCSSAEVTFLSSSPVESGVSFGVIHCEEEDDMIFGASDGIGFRLCDYQVSFPGWKGKDWG